MQANAVFASQRHLRLTRAILFYAVSNGTEEATGNTNNAGNFATSHQIVAGPGGQPRIDAGAPLDVLEIERMVRGLERNRPQGVEMIPPTLLASSSRTMVWHRPASPARLWFEATAFKDNAENKDLQKLSGELFPQPHMLFACKGHDLHLFAMAGDERPTEKTKLYRCPHWNIYDSGRLCVGSTKLPRQPNHGDIAAIEKSYFQSRFTHLHGSACIKGSFATTWADIYRRKLKRFPDELLIEQKGLTLGHLLGILSKETIDLD